MPSVDADPRMEAQRWPEEADMDLRRLSDLFFRFNIHQAIADAAPGLGREVGHAPSRKGDQRHRRKRMRAIRSHCGRRGNRSMRAKLRRI